MRKLGLTGLLAGIGLLASLGAAQAQFFNYSAVFTPNPFPTTSPNELTATNVSQTATFAGLAGSNIVTTNLSTVSSAPDGTPVTLSGPYNIALTLAPSDSLGNPLAAGITQNFTGTLNGTVSANTSNIANLFTSGPQSYNFGTFGTFQAALTSYTPPGAQGGGVGAIGAHVNGQIALTAGTPEPGSVAMLFGMGVTGAAFVYRRRRTRK